MRKLLVLALVPVTLSLARPAAASCLPAGPLPERLAQAPVVFVGTVLSTTNRDRVAQVRVEEVWKGPDLADQVEVRGTTVLPTENAATSVDRTFRAGTRYLFVPLPAESAVAAGAGGAGFEDGLCTATQEYRAELDALRPASIGQPAGPISAGGPDGDDDGSGLALPLPAAVAVALAAASFGGLWVLARKRRAARTTASPPPSMPV